MQDVVCDFTLLNSMIKWVSNFTVTKPCKIFIFPDLCASLIAYRFDNKSGSIILNLILGYKMNYSKHMYKTYQIANTCTKLIKFGFF